MVALVFLLPTSHGCPYLVRLAERYSPRKFHPKLPTRQLRSCVPLPVPKPYPMNSLPFFFLLAILATCHLSYVLPVVLWLLN